MSLLSYLQAMAALAALLALLVGGAAFLRRSKSLDRLRDYLKLPERSIQLTSSLALDAKTRLVVVRDGEREHLILVGQGRLIESRPASAVEAAVSL